MQTHMPKSEIELEAAAAQLKYFKHMSQPIVDKLHLKIQSKINLIINLLKAFDRHEVFL